MAKSSGSTRATNSKAAAASRKNGDMTQYITEKVREIDFFKMPRRNDFEYIEIKGQNYRVVRLSSGYKESVSLRDKDNNVMVEYKHIGSKNDKYSENWKKIAMGRIRSKLHKILTASELA